MSRSQWKSANTGARSGSTVVQLYVADPASGLPRPVKELKAFTKVSLAAGESQRVTLELSARDFSYFDTAAKQWLVESGDFVLHVALSATETISSLPVSRRPRSNFRSRLNEGPVLTPPRRQC